MNYQAQTARRYRAHAKELRLIAADDLNEDTRKALIKVARDYENMSRTLEQTDEMILEGSVASV